MLVVSSTSQQSSTTFSSSASAEDGGRDEGSESSSSSGSSSYIPTIAPRAKRARTPNVSATATSVPVSVAAPSISITTASTTTASNMHSSDESAKVQQAQQSEEEEQAKGIAWPSKMSDNEEARNPVPGGNRLRIDLSSLGAFNASTARTLGPATPGVIMRTVSAPHTTSTDVRAPAMATSSSVSSLPSAPALPTYIRKKSGEPLKSSLKARRPVVRGDLSVVTTPTGMAKSEPSTPTHILKSVHFDAKLEHVKLFLAEQKPLAVSRDGSPTDDTSGTDSDFPSFIYGKEKGRKGMVVKEGEKKLAMRVLDDLSKAKLVNDKSDDGRDVVLEDLALSSDGLSVSGHVRVRNLAFEKWVAVRFTFDSWQTTSEVAAKYVRSSADGQWDWFGFVIRLNDLVSRIEGRTMWAAIRYRVGGKEIWDNNGGRNYRTDFEKVLVQGEKEMEVLKDKLELVARSQSQHSAKIASGSTVSSSPSSLSSSSSLASKDHFDLRSKTPLSGRYDLSASFKKVSSPSSSSSSSKPSLKAFTHFSSFTPGHTRTRTFPTAPAVSPLSPPTLTRRPPGSSSFRAPDKLNSTRDPHSLVRGSPRIFDPSNDANSPSSSSSPFYTTSEIEVVPDLPSPDILYGSHGRRRNHQRSYFDLGIAHGAGVRKTQAGSPGFGERDGGMGTWGGIGMGSSRFSSFPPISSPVEGPRGFRRGTPSPPQSQAQVQSSAATPAWMLHHGGSEESTPSVTSASESSRSSSPSGSVDEPIMFGSEGAEQESSMDMSNLNVLLNRYCISFLFPFRTCMVSEADDFSENFQVLLLYGLRLAP